MAISVVSELAIGPEGPPRLSAESHPNLRYFPEMYHASHESRSSAPTCTCRGVDLPPLRHAGAERGTLTVVDEELGLLSALDAASPTSPTGDEGEGRRIRRRVLGIAVIVLCSSTWLGLWLVQP